MIHLGYYWLAGGFVWGVCGVIAYGMMVGAFVKQFPYFPISRVLTAVMFIGGPLSVVVSLLWCPRPYAFRLVPPTKAERWMAHKKKWPALSYKDFEETDR